MSHRYYLGVDQGTTGTTVLVFDADWNVCSRGYRELTQYYPRPGWVEHDPLEIWKTVCDATCEALRKAGINAGQVRAMGLDNQGETCMVWDRKSGEPVYNAIVWQDRRTAPEADELKQEKGEFITQRTGVPVDAYFSALKLRWILDNVTGARKRAQQGELLAGTLDTYLIWRLTGGKSFVTDPSTASRTMMFNLHTGQWDDDILEAVGVPRTILPEIVDSVGIFGHATGGDFPVPELPIAGCVVDQAAALFGQACIQKGMAKTTYGTGCFMLMNTGSEPVSSRHGLVTTVVWGMDRRLTYALDGGVYIAGAAIQWLRDGLRIIESAVETENIAASVTDTGGVCFVPAFVGLAAPHWDQYARGMMIGITGGTTRAHIVRAALEAIAFQVRENLDVMRMDSGLSIDVMRADGGAAVNRFLMQFQADMLGIPVDVPVVNETTALGVACLAALGVGDFLSVQDVCNAWKLGRRYEPAINEDQREARFEQWKRAVERSKGWAAGCQDAGRPVADGPSGA